ncbi:prolipoprotein diacylglyceryl transferase [Candidatus Parcubacteria bacterium]|nr:MAG: prolipoprotein diacylglyceryl transferase [Candidatus Parcubacteria bacterium]
MNFLHTFTPNSVLISFGPFTIYFYGFFIVCGILLGSTIVLKLAEKYHIEKNTIIDMAFWVIIVSIAGGRLYHIFLELPYYLEHPLQTVMIWRGGLAIHGAIIAGFFTTYFLAKKNQVNPIQLLAMFAPALALGQALGRWGNYFNQELFGLPTNLPWGIPIEYQKRVAGFEFYEYFHTTFLYESIGSVFIVIFLLYLHRVFIKNKIDKYEIIVAFYLLLYSILRFSLEFVRIDKTPELLGLRFPQIASIILAIISLYVIFKNKKTLCSLIKTKERKNA